MKKNSALSVFSELGDWFLVAVLITASGIICLVMRLMEGSDYFFTTYPDTNTAHLVVSTHYLLYHLWHIRLRRRFGLPRLDRHSGWQFFERHTYIATLIAAALAFSNLYIVEFAELPPLVCFFSTLVMYYGFTLVFCRWHRDEIPWPGED